MSIVQLHLSSLKKMETLEVEGFGKSGERLRAFVVEGLKKSGERIWKLIKKIKRGIRSTC